MLCALKTHNVCITWARNEKGKGYMKWKHESSNRQPHCGVPAINFDGAGKQAQARKMEMQRRVWCFACPEQRGVGLCCLCCTVHSFRHREHIFAFAVQSTRSDIARTFLPLLYKPLAQAFYAHFLHLLLRFLVQTLRAHFLPLLYSPLVQTFQAHFIFLLYSPLVPT